MANFDIINAAGNAYAISWHSRRYLVRLAFVPFALKLFCFTMAWVFTKGAAVGEGGSYDTYLTFMLIMLPALFAEGWMLSHYVRFIMLRQTWPFRPSGNMDDDLALLKIRARGVLGGTVVFVLINMVVGFFTAMAGQYLMPYVHLENADAAEKIPAYIGLISLVGLVAMFWGFRLLWLYIPYALNMDARNYLRGLKGQWTSMHMIGVWLLCYIPFFLGLRLIVAMISMPIGMAFGETGASFVSVILVVLADTAKSIVTTAGITFGLKEIFLQKGATR